MSSKKIVIIGPAHPLRGGLASFNERLAKQFSDEGNDVTIYTFSLQYPSFLFPGTTQYSSDQAPHNIKIKVCINSINPLNWLSVGLDLKKMKPDLIVVRYWLPFMGPCLGSILRLVKKNYHTKVVCIADNIIPHESRIGDAQFTNYFLKPIDSFLLMSAKVQSDLKTLTQKPSELVAHPLYDNFGKSLSKVEAKKYLKINSEHKIFLFFGFIRKYKGLDLLLNAIGILKENNFLQKNSIRFLIAGEFYEDSKPYLEEIEQLKIAPFINLQNHFIADSEVKYYLSACDCVIQPYKNATQSGVTPLAYHFEKPMIVTNVGGLPELVPANVGLVAEPNATSIAAKIMEFNQMDAQKFESNIREEKKKYTWTNITQAIERLSFQ